MRGDYNVNRKVLNIWFPRLEPKKRMSSAGGLDLCKVHRTGRAAVELFEDLKGSRLLPSGLSLLQENELSPLRYGNYGLDGGCPISCSGIRQR